jgi:hypothetical protein
MRMLSVLTLVGLGLIFACGDGDGSGACEKSASGNDYCLNFKDETTGIGDAAPRTGEEICSEQDGSWTADSSCQDLGYDTECSTGSFVKPSGSCP